MNNRIAKNRKSPANEEMYIQEYLKMNPKAKRNDKLDIAAVTTLDGIKGHGLLPEKFNRSHDNNNHIVKDFIPDNILRQKNK